MTKTQAELCPGIAWRQRSLSQESTAHSALLDCAWTISPRVEDQEQLLDTVVVDIAGCEKLLGSPDKIAGDLRRVAAEVGFDANVAVAANAESAICAARGFPGITVIPAGDEAARIGVLPLSSLMIPGELLDTLARWGIHTCAEFAALPEIAVVERVGQEGRRWQLMTRGADARPLLPKDPPLQFEECMDLEFPVELLEPLMFVMNRLLEGLCTRLSMHVLATNEIQLTLTLQGNGSRSKESLLHVRTLRLPVPARESKLFLKLLQLELQNHPPNAPVIGVKISALPARPRTRQLGLFLPLSPEPELLEVTLARIRNTVGFDRVGSPVLLDTHRPDAFRQTHFVLPESTTPKLQRRTTAALRMYRPPLPAVVELREKKPAAIICDGTRRQIFALSGPWRSKGEWWSETAWARDDWDVFMEALRPAYRRQASEPLEEDTALYRIYRDLRLRRWFIEGIYD